MPEKYKAKNPILFIELKLILYMNKTIFFYLAITFLFYACKEKAYHTYKYYESGELMHEYVFKNKNDTSSYTFYEFFKNGELKKEINVKDNKKEGRYIKYYENGEIKEFISFKNDLPHGEYKKYNKYGKLDELFFLLNGRNFLYKEYIYNPPFKAIFVYKEVDSEKGMLVKEGLLNFKNDTIIRDTSMYYYTYADDTIVNNKEYDFVVEYYNNKKNGFSSNLIIGDINKKLQFVDSSKVKLFKSDSLCLRVSYCPEKEGVNLILGHLQIINDSTNQIEKDYLYYHQFYVIKSND